MSHTDETTLGPERLDMRSHDIVGDGVAELLRLFPEISTGEGRLDFDRLKLALGEFVDVGKERYGLNWPGKSECFKTIQMPSLGTLLPCPDESVNFATTDNLIIEGDNLEVLKLLQKSYLGKVKMIYMILPTTQATTSFTRTSTRKAFRRTWNTRGRSTPRARSSARTQTRTGASTRTG